MGCGRSLVRLENPSHLHCRSSASWWQVSYSILQVKVGHARPGQSWISDSEVGYGEVRGDVSAVTAGREEEVGGVGDDGGAGHLTQL